MTQVQAHNFECSDFAKWHSIVCSTYDKTNGQLLAGEDFHGSLEVKSFGPCQISHISSKPVAYHRRPESEADLYYIVLSMCPLAQVVQSDRESLQKAGDIVIYDSSRPYSCRFPSGDNQIVLSVPHSVMNKHMFKAASLLSLTLHGNLGVGRLSRSMMLEMWRSQPTDGNIESRLLGSLLDVLAASYDSEYGESDVNEKTRQLQQLDRIKSYILDNLGNSDLTIESVALDTYVSERTLNRLFAGENTTAYKWLWQQRLMASHRLLVSNKSKSVSDIATDFGFKNLSHFSRSFRDYYGMTPRETRRL
ncbi:AraC family transcriptional regulator [Pseudomonas fluorescens]|uniref:AraC family transcriptional regulator n=1 Tax=Pseudomonas fluorescens TaxID=294 RepID=A0A327N7Q5_PSEFL|nr:helix-turn-helix domain-containing protein [Pseudomonas fluorescens]RAI70875.1 AraC family transcriptional regulator [Pseudomonas fluorescens]